MKFSESVRIPVGLIFNFLALYIHLWRRRYVVGLLSNVTTIRTNTPLLLRHVSTVSPNGVHDLVSALHEQLCHAAACLTATAEDRWEFTQTAEKLRSGCYAAALLSKLTTHPDIRAATVIKKPLSDDKNHQTIQDAMRQRESEARADAEKANDLGPADEDDRKSTKATHRALDRDWWQDTLSYECPIAEKMFRLLESDDAMSHESNLGHYAAITLWHLTSSPENDQRVRRTIGANTSGWISMTNRLAKPAIGNLRNRADSRVLIVSTIWNLLRVSEFQPKLRFTDKLMPTLVQLCNAIAREDPAYCYGTTESMAQLRSRLAGLLTEVVRDPANAAILAAESDLHSTLIDWMDVEKFEADKAQLMAAQKAEQVEQHSQQGEKRGFLSKRWSKLGKQDLNLKSRHLHGVVQAKSAETIEFAERISFAERTVYVKHVAKQWLEEQTLCSRMAAQYGSVCGCIIRVKSPDDDA